MKCETICGECDAVIDTAVGGPLTTGVLPCGHDFGAIAARPVYEPSFGVDRLETKADFRGYYTERTAVRENGRAWEGTQREAHDKARRLYRQFGLGSRGRVAFQVVQAKPVLR